MKIMTVVKSLNLVSYALQLAALSLATRVDLKALAISQAEDDLDEGHFVNIYKAARDGRARPQSQAEDELHKLVSADDGKRNAALLRWAAALVAVSVVLQGIATCLGPG